ncbi:MAG: MBL fold metallo-hydrolase [Chloroflexota bacterium]|nr:MBL fold metallo-hydrolase [Chloroflexota bacterium]
MSHTLVADNIYQVQLPLPFALRSVNCYLLRGDNGWDIIDTGLHTPDGEAGWRAVFAELGVQPGDLRQVVVTHHHPDHYGMAGWLREWNGGELTIYMAARELAMVEQVWWQQEGMGAAFSAFMQRAGVSGDMLTGMLEVSAEIRTLTRPHPPTIDTITAGDVLTLGGRSLRVLNGPGHSVGQALLYDAADKLFFCADHILLKITPNVGLWPGSDDDPLAAFLDSLRELSALDVRLGLPGHKTLIHDWQGRIAELEHHHDERLVGTAAAAGKGATALGVAQTIFDFRNFTFHEMRFAVAEALAHLEYLRLRGELRREVEDGVWVYRE